MKLAPVLLANARATARLTMTSAVVITNLAASTRSANGDYIDGAPTVINTIGNLTPTKGYERTTDARVAGKTLYRLNVPWNIDLRDSSTITVDGVPLEVYEVLDPESPDVIEKSATVFSG